MMPALIELAAVDSGGGGGGTLVPAHKRGPSTESMAAGCSNSASPYIRTPDAKAHDAPRRIALMLVSLCRLPPAK